MKKTGRSEEKLWLKIVRSMSVAAGIGMILCAGLMALCSWAIVSLHRIPTALIPGLILAVIAVSSLLSGFLSAKMVGKRGLFIGAGSGAILCFVFWIAVLCFNGSLQGSLAKIPVFLLAGALGGYLASLRKR